MRAGRAASYAARRVAAIRAPQETPELGQVWWHQDENAVRSGKCGREGRHIFDTG